jgi:uncharacterized membrane protein YfcA
VSTTQLLVIVVASFAGALVKGVTGLGYPVLAVPLIALVTGIEDAVVVVAIPNLLANIVLCWEARDARGESRDLGRLVGFGIVGAVIGTVALVRLPEQPLLIALALTVGVFVVQMIRRPELGLAPATATRWSPVAGFVTGLMQGAVGVSGPVVATWLHGYRLAVQTYVFSVTVIFGVTGAVQLVVLTAQGQLHTDRLLGALLAGVGVAIALPLGLRLRRRLAGPTFEKIVLAVLLVSAVSLVFEAFT